MIINNSDELQKDLTGLVSGVCTVARKTGEQFRLEPAVPGWALLFIARKNSGLIFNLWNTTM